MENSSIYRAPSIPKLSKSTISSPVIRGVSNISKIFSPLKLRKTTFSFIKKNPRFVDSEALKPETSPIEAPQLQKTLIETNKILVEIQKQLSLDFATRIAQEKEEIKKIKAVQSRTKFANKEKSIEDKKNKVIGSGIIQKITTPIKSVFDKIKEFFSLILTGIVLNAAFKWLQDPNNKTLIDGIFNWIGKLFVPAVIAIIGYKVFKWVRRLFLFGRWMWKLAGRLSQVIRNLPSPYRGPRQGPRQKPPLRQNLPVSPLTKGPGTQPGVQPSLPRPLLGPTGQPLPVNPLRGTTPARAPGIPKPGTGITPKPQTSPAPKGPPRGQLPGFFGKTLRVLGLAFLISELQEDWRRGDLKAIAVKLSAYGLGWLTTILVAAGGTALGIGTAPTGVGVAAGFGLAASSVAAGYGVDVGIRKAFGYKDGGTIKASNGMTVPGRGSGSVDSVPAKLAPGEEVIRTSEAMKWRPLLKDINDNAGRMWVMFSQAVAKLFSVSEKQKSISEEFSKVIEDFDKFLDAEIKKKRITNPNTGFNWMSLLTGSGGGSGGGTRSQNQVTGSGGSQRQATLKSSPQAPRTVVYQTISSSSSGMTFLPMMLPKQSSKPPQIPQISTPATEAPVLDPVDASNPYIMNNFYGIPVLS